MMLRKRNFRRASKCREAKKVIIIATEGEKTEPKYFNDLKQKYRKTVVHLEVIRRCASASSPIHVIQELLKFKAQYELENNDELWMIIDRDRWTESMLSKVAKLCFQKNFHLALSNPCFEVWLLLHLVDISNFSQRKIRMLEKNRNNDLENEIREFCGSYNKSNLKTHFFLDNVDKAIDRARNIDKHPDHRWPNSLGTRVYLLAENVVNA